MSVRRQRESTFENTVRKSIARGSDNVPVHYLPFHATRNLFRNYLGYTGPLSYDEWMDVDDEDKAAVLYVQFYSQIVLAWNKVKSFYTIEEDGVETILQYLMKNVPIIMNDPKRFTARYIYRVASNCLYCICHDIKRDRDRWELEVSNIQSSGDSEDTFDLFDTLVDESSGNMEGAIAKEEFWKVVDSLGDDVLKVVEKLLNGNKISGKKNLECVEILRINLAKFRDLI